MEGGEIPSSLGLAPLIMPFCRGGLPTGCVILGRTGSSEPTAASPFLPTFLWPPQLSWWGSGRQCRGVKKVIASAFLHHTATRKQNQAVLNCPAPPNHPLRSQQDIQLPSTTWTAPLAGLSQGLLSSSLSLQNLAGSTPSWFSEHIMCITSLIPHLQPRLRARPVSYHLLHK